MKNNNAAFFFRQGLFFTTVLMTLYSCTENNKQQPNIAIKKDSMVPPRVIVLANLPDSDKPRVTYLDKVPKPATLVNPRTSVTHSFIDPITHTVIAPEAQGIGFFTNYNTEQGLTLDGVSSGYCDRAGNLWFGTGGGGASRYDGKAFTNFTTSNGIADVIINCITEDSLGNMWFGTNMGASKYDGRSFTNFTTADGLANNQVTIIREDKSGNLWFGTLGGGISRYDGRSFTNFTTADGLANNTVLSIREDKSGNIWFGTTTGISKYDGKSFTNFTTKDGLVNNFVSSIAEDKTGNIWFGTLGGVSRYDGKSFTNFTTAEGLVNNRINDIAEDKSGNLWFATLSGVTKYDGKSFVSYTEEQGLPNNDVQSITEDKSGNLWFGTIGGGVSRYDGESIVSFTQAQGLTNNTVYGMAKDKSGNLWFGTEGGGLLRYDGKSFTNFNASHWIQNSSPVDIITQDKSGNLWFGSLGGGATCYDGKSFTRFTTAQGLAGNSVSCITEDKSGNLWFSTSNGLSCYDGKSFTNFTTKQGLIDNNIQCAIKDKSGNLWFGTTGGEVSRYDGKSFTNFTSAQGLPKDEMFGIMEDRSGNLWFATSGGGVSRYDGKSFTNFTTMQGLADNTVYCEITDKQGNIVFGTNLGFTILKGFSPLTAGKDAGAQLIQPSNNLSNETLKSYKPIFEIYNQNTGYPIKDLNRGGSGSNGAILCDSSGIIWAGTGEKLIRFDYSAITKSIAIPSAFIQSIKIDNEDISWYDLASSKKNAEDSMAIINEEVILFGNVLSDSLEQKMHHKFGNIKFDSITKWYPIPENLILPYEHNSITFEFGARELARGKLVKYQYFLKGYDKDWSPISKRTSAGFSNIYEGTYTFQLKAQSPDGVWSEPITYTFKVLPPWYRTWWAYSLYVLLIVFTGLAIGRWQRHRVIAKERQLAEFREAKLKAEAENERRKNIELISEIGKDITGSLSVEHIIDTVYLHVNKLMDASVFGIGIYNKDRQYLEFPATKEKGRTLPAYSYGLSDKNRPASWCFNNKKEIFMNDFEKEHQDYIEYIPAAAAGDNTASVIYLPLVNKDKNIGVLTAQSFVKNAYTDFHLEILRSIATYTALALDNADAYRDLKSTQAQLIQSEKMASLGELTAGIAHEIQNPLNFVNNFSDVNKELLTEMKDEMNKGNLNDANAIANDVIANEEKINHHGKRAGDIVKGMLQHSQKSTGLKEPTDINALADEYLRLSYHGLRAKDKTFNAKMETDFDSSIGKINIIPQDIGRVLLNLYNNAFYAVKERQEAEGKEYEPTVSVRTKKSENHVLISVSDNGNGIPQKIVDKIFQPFFTTKPTGQGTGLGLSLSYDIVKAHGGEIKVETKEGEGSEFIIQIPVKNI